MTKIIPSFWLQPCAMRGIVVHWTAGAHTVSALDEEHYHIIVAGNGVLKRGDHDIKDNVSSGDGDYAAHTRGLNTGFIGVSMAAMAGAIESPFKAGQFPLTKTQWDVCAQVVAELCQFYKIPLTRRTVLHHGEVQATLGIQQRGKWDALVLPWDPDLSHAQVGDLFRTAVAAHLSDDDLTVPMPVEPDPPAPAAPLVQKYKVGNLPADDPILIFRASPGGSEKGRLREGIVVQRFDTIDGWARVKTPAGYVGWVAARYLTPVT